MPARGGVLPHERHEAVTVLPRLASLTADVRLGMLAAMATHERTRPSARRPLMALNDLCRHLGISRGTAYALVRDGGLPAVRIGERLRFRPQDVDRWIAERAVPAGSDAGPRDAA